MNAIDRIGQNPVPLRVDTMATSATGGLGARASGPGTGSVAQQQTGVATGGPQMQSAMRLPTPATVASTYATVSSDARVLDALARLPSEEPLILSEKPLCPVPPASTTTQAGELPNVGSHFTSLLAKALVQSLENSGLFYESHLAQWASGQRPLAAIEREPQARLAPLAGTGAETPQDTLPAHDTLIANALTAFQSNAGALAGTNPAPAGDWFSRVADVLQNTLSGTSQANNANNSSGAGHGAAGDSQSGSAGANAGNATGHAPGGLAGMASPLLEALSHLSPFSSHPSSHANAGNSALNHNALSGFDPNGLDAHGMPNSLSHAVHPDALPMVRQQMELLQNPTLRWTGEAWPGTQMEWEIERREEAAAHGGHDGQTEPSWRMQITLDLPQLGHVDAELHLVGDRLITRLKAAPECAAALLHDSDHFRERIANTGLELKGFAVRELQSTGGDPAHHDDGVRS